MGFNSTYARFTLTAAFQVKDADQRYERYQYACNDADDNDGLDSSIAKPRGLGSLIDRVITGVSTIIADRRFVNVVVVKCVLFSNDISGWSKPDNLGG